MRAFLMCLLVLLAGCATTDTPFPTYDHPEQLTESVVYRFPEVQAEVVVQDGFLYVRDQTQDAVNPGLARIRHPIEGEGPFLWGVDLGVKDGNMVTLFVEGNGNGTVVYYVNQTG